jgi:hypothetical protein
MKKNLKYLLVPENFARMIKVNSSIEGKSIIEYTEDMGKRMEDEFNNMQKKQKRTFEFGL